MERTDKHIAPRPLPFSLLPSPLPLLLALIVLLTACANPVPPSGGPEDTTPPSVVRSRPVADTVNVPTSTQSLRIEFSEYVERGSLPRALTVTPAFERPLSYDWDGRAVDIEFPSALRDSTTYIFTLDTELSDTRGVDLEEPLTIAFATGPRINRGKLAGRVVEPTRGAPQAKVDIYAYGVPTDAAPDSLPEQPAYRTQTGEDGTFAFDYLREQRYYVVALRDNNRNRRPDLGEPVAPPPRATFPADSAGVGVTVPWVLARTDTAGPAAQRAVPLSQRRVAVRFSEPVRLAGRDPDRWALQDSLRQAAVPVAQVYQPEATPTEVVLRTEAMRDARHRLIVGDSAVVDTLGQPIRPDTVRFQAATRLDTLQTRFEGFGPPGLSADSLGAFPLLPSVLPTVAFNQAPGPSVLQQAVSVQDTTGAARAFSLSSDDGVTYTVQLDTLAPGAQADVRIDGSALAGLDSTATRRYRRLPPGVLGGLEGRVLLADTTLETVASPDSSAPAGGPTAGRQRPETPPDSLRADSLRADTRQADSLQQDTVQADTTQADTTQADTTQEVQPEGPVVVELYAQQASPPVQRRSLTTPPDSAFVFTQLPVGTYRFRAFVDRNANGRWDPGALVPYRRAEPVTWSAQPIDTRKRWTTVLPAPLRIFVLP